MRPSTTVFRGLLPNAVAFHPVIGEPAARRKRRLYGVSLLLITQSFSHPVVKEQLVLLDFYSIGLPSPDGVLRNHTTTGNKSQRPFHWSRSDSNMDAGLGKLLVSHG